MIVLLHQRKLGNYHSPWGVTTSYLVSISVYTYDMISAGYSSGRCRTSIPVNERRDTKYEHSHTVVNAGVYSGVPATISCYTISGRLKHHRGRTLASRPWSSSKVGGEALFGHIYRPSKRTSVFKPPAFM